MSMRDIWGNVLSFCGDLRKLPQWKKDLEDLWWKYLTHSHFGQVHYFSLREMMDYFPMNTSRKKAIWKVQNTHQMTAHLCDYVMGVARQVDVDPAMLKRISRMRRDLQCSWRNAVKYREQGGSSNGEVLTQDQEYFMFWMKTWTKERNELRTEFDRLVATTIYSLRWKTRYYPRRLSREMRARWEALRARYLFAMHMRKIA